ncbi:uncharacterized protein LOC8283986 isoform X1 [Ricinus communis]|uniref:uncharacterized protein LOC8283986 isoform X1 n=1 Tax=Ricinus communis TaxID=3988 RepID=UPI00077285ED|nr:uncharacterized protein LOC8283986 isoform X1 [Ricinus communis]XP_048225621.1 uncharacterized protein LOC8283986 isoform X1 [Ricinus communis]|eukprot:XP_015574878.1 uncharacterized protein LOC8283986 isoform X1 [Ricinus communis]
MENNGSNSHSHDNGHLGGTEDPNKENCTEKDVFVNHAEITWHKKRKQWVGDRSQKSQKMPREPIMRECKKGNKSLSLGETCLQKLPWILLSFAGPQHMRIYFAQVNLFSSRYP